MNEPAAPEGSPTTDEIWEVPETMRAVVLTFQIAFDANLSRRRVIRLMRRALMKNFLYHWWKAPKLADDVIAAELGASPAISNLYTSSEAS